METKYITETACSTNSLVEGESLAATATHTRSWLLLQYEDAWEGKAFEASHLPQEVKTYLIEVQKLLEAPRLQLIKGKTKTTSPHISFYVIRPNEDQPVMYRFQLEDYRDLLSLDIPAVLAGDPRYQSQQTTRSTFLICTNARRDPCCAHFGTAAFHKLAEYQEKSMGKFDLWQTIHVGGHRFAPNMLYFPYGLYFGRMHPDHVKQVAARCLEGQLSMGYYRGRAEYREPLQAAEIYLRQQTGRLDIDAFHFSGLDNPEADLWLVHFTEQSNGRQYQLALHLEKTGGKVLQSCGEENPAPIKLYRLVSMMEKT